MTGFDIYYQNNGEYPPPEEIEINRGIHRIEGYIPDFEPDESIQYLDYDSNVDVDGELKRLHFVKLDVLSDGSFVAIIDVRDNPLWLVLLPYVIYTVILGGTGIAVITVAGKAAEKSEDALKATAVNLQWVAVIVISIGVFYMIGFRK